jgi:phospholipid-transporting ATPase
VAVKSARALIIAIDPQIVFWIVLAAFANAAVFGNGQTVGQWTVGTTVYTAVFLTATFKAALIMEYA